MIRFLKYLISLFFIFGLTINESAAYASKDNYSYQVTETLLGNEEISIEAKTYFYSCNSKKRISSTVVAPLNTLWIEKAHCRQIRITLMTTELLSLEIGSIMRLRLLQEIITTKNSPLLFTV